MKYSDYVKNQASITASFAGDVVEAAFNHSTEYSRQFVESLVTYSAAASEYSGNMLESALVHIGSIPEYAGAVSEMAANGLVSVSEYSYEFSEGIISAASKLAELSANLLSNSPEYLASLREIASNYSVAAIAAAQNYLSNREDENCLQWIQKQDDGVYISGNWGTSSGVSDDWEIPEHFRKYPEGVPPVPPQVTPASNTHIIKIPPPDQKVPHGCLNLKDPILGEVISVNRHQDDNHFFLYWFDNKYFRRQTQSRGQPPIHTEQFISSPCSMPRLSEFEKFGLLPKGRYAILEVGHNGVPDNTPGFYNRVEGWDWNWTEFGVERNKQHENEYWPCLAIEFNDYVWSHYHYYAPDSIECSGFGHAIHYTNAYALLEYLGNTFPPVEETPFYSAVTLSLSSIGIVEAFRNAINMIFPPIQRS